MLLQHTTDLGTSDLGPTDVERVRAAIGRLSPAQRDLLVLRFRDGQSTSELAATTGTSTATVMRLLHHAAWMVEDITSPGVPGALVHGQRPPRSAELVVEEADLGITPLLAARLTAAVTGPELPHADEHWRWHALVAALRRHGEGVVTTALTAAVVLPAVVSLGA